MPRLPSGLHFGLAPHPLIELIDSVRHSKDVHRLMAIETLTDLAPHLDVLYFRPREGLAVQREYSASSALPPEDLEPYPSGFTLATFAEQAGQWSAEDQAAFEAYLAEPRLRDFLQEKLDAVMAMKEELRQQPGTMPGLLAAYWRMGCHPLQPGNDKD